MLLLGSVVSVSSTAYANDDTASIKQACRDLVLDYAFYRDRPDATGVVNLFTEDGVIELLGDQFVGKEPIRALPAAFVDRLAALDYDSIKNAVGDYLKNKDIERLLIRRDKILEEVERLKKIIPNFLY